MRRPALSCMPSVASRLAIREVCHQTTDFAITAEVWISALTPLPLALSQLHNALHNHLAKSHNSTCARNYWNIPKTIPQLPSLVPQISYGHNPVYLLYGRQGQNDPYPILDQGSSWSAERSCCLAPWSPKRLPLCKSAMLICYDRLSLSIII